LLREPFARSNFRHDLAVAGDDDLLAANRLVDQAGELVLRFSDAVAGQDVGIADLWL
jgi:hypothetical protein